MDRASPTSAPLILVPSGITGGPSDSPFSLLGSGSGQVVLADGVNPAAFSGNEFVAMQRALATVVDGSVTPAELERRLGRVFHSIAATPLDALFPLDIDRDREGESFTRAPHTAEAVQFLKRHPRLERRLMTCLRLDTASFTVKTDNMDSTEILEFQEQLRRVMVRICDAHGGVYQDFTGDGYQFVWGIDRLDPDDTFHAVNAALEILAWSKKFNEDRVAQGKVGFQVRIGVDTGVGTPQWTYLEGVGSIRVSGPLMARTQRTEDFIKNGDLETGKDTADVVCVTQTTLNFCGDRFVTKARGMLTGKRREAWEDVNVFEVKHLRPTAVSLRAFAQEGTVFVDRSEEMRNLQGEARLCFEESKSRAVLVVGDQGVGKTRMLREFYGRADDFDRALTVMSGQGVNLPTTSVNRDIVSVLRGHFKIDGLEHAEAFHILHSDLTVAFAALGDEDREDMIQLIACFLGVDIPERFRKGRVVPLIDDPRKIEQLREESQEAVIQYFDALLRTRPLVMMLDDLQWFDRGSLGFLERLRRRLAHRSLFMLGAVRTDAIATLGWTGEMTLHQPLKPLGDLDLGAIVADVLPSADDALKEYLVRESRGNPDQLRDLVRLIRDFSWQLGPDGRLRSLEGRAWTSGSAFSSEVRLDQLKKTDINAYEVLGCAAVIDGDFSQGDLDRLGAPVTDKNLEVLVRLQFIVPTTPGRYRFTTDQLRETAYGRLSPEDIRRRHLRYLEILHDQRETDPAVLAYHLERSGDFHQAADLYYQAADRAYFQKGVVEVADHLYANAYRVASILKDRTRQWKILRSWDEAAFLGRRYDLSIGIFEKSLSLATLPGDLAGAHYRMARALTRTRGKVKEAVPHLDTALGILERWTPESDQEKKDRDNLCGGLLVEKGFNYTCQGQRTEAITQYQVARDFGVSNEHLLTQARAWTGLAHVKGQRGDYFQATQDTRNAVRCYRALVERDHNFGDERRLITVLSMLGNQLVESGSYKEGLKILEEATRMAQAFGGVGQGMDAVYNSLGRALYLNGKNDDAIKLLEKRVLLPRNDRDLIFDLAVLAQSYLAAGFSEKAKKVADRILVEADTDEERAIGHMVFTQVWMDISRGPEKHYEEALHHSTLALEARARTNSIEYFDLEILLTHALLLRVLDRFPEAIGVMEEAKKKLDSLKANISDQQDQERFVANNPVYVKIESFHYTLQEMARAAALPEHARDHVVAYLGELSYRVLKPDQWPDRVHFMRGVPVARVVSLDDESGPQVAAGVLVDRPLPTVLRALITQKMAIKRNPSVVPGVYAADVRWEPFFGQDRKLYASIHWKVGTDQQLLQGWLEKRMGIGGLLRGALQAVLGTIAGPVDELIRQIIGNFVPPELNELMVDYMACHGGFPMITLHRYQGTEVMAADGQVQQIDPELRPKKGQLGTTRLILIATGEEQTLFVVEMDRAIYTQNPAGLMDDGEGNGFLSAILNRAITE